LEKTFLMVKQARIVTASMFLVSALAWKEGLTNLPRPADIAADLRSKIFKPVYQDYA
jgi:hypothetical protein